MTEENNSRPIKRVEVTFANGERLIVPQCYIDSIDSSTILLSEPGEGKAYLLPAQNPLSVFASEVTK